MKKLPLFLLLFSFCFSFSQIGPNVVPSTSYKERANAFTQRKKLDDASLVASVKFRSVGPTIMSGRVVDIDVSPTDPTHFYVAYASGGLWKTENNGLTFTPLFDNEESMTIGDFAVDWTSGAIWIGTGENNSSRSSYSGTGVYKSSDGGKTWEHKGLEETQHIGKIMVSPNDPNTIWVAALGHLFSPNKERGIYKTTDGGKTWKQVLFKDENTGAIDMQMDPSDPKIMYATLWHRVRRAWNFEEAGSTSGIYKSEDGGDTWKLLSDAKSGFPTSNGAGRIGLAIYPKNPDIMYAIVDIQDARKDEKKKDDTKLTKDKLKKISNDEFLKLDDKLINAFLDDNDFPDKYNAAGLKTMVKNGKLKPIQLAEFLEDANAQLFDSPIVGPEVYRSDDAGKSWKKQNTAYIDELFFTYGYYFGRVWVSPNDPNKIYLAGLFPIRSDDGGKTFTRMYSGNVHADHHAMWLNPKRDGHIINGNDGGVNISYDDGKTWYKCNTPPVGQFYSVNYDMEDPYNVYGGLQDNGVWTGSSQSDPTDMSWLQEGSNPFKSIMGGDGMQVQVDTRDNATVYTGYQFGSYFRINKNTGEQKYITPQHDLGERPYRWNWQAPILISKHNKDIIYMCSDHFHRSMNKGDDFKTLSGDLTNGGKKGDVAYGTLTCIDESPMKFGLLYVGSDDGLVQMSKDDGSTWNNVTGSLPKNLWVRRVAASAFDEGTVYVCLNGHTWDHFNSYLYVSKNYGSSWEKIGLNLPLEPINVVKEDPANSNVLYVGTDNGVYVSLDKGKSFMRMSNGLPSVAVHDLCIQPRANDLIVGTHGRSIYIASVKELQQLTDSVMMKGLYVFDLPETKYRSNWGKKDGAWGDTLVPEFKVPFYLKKAGKIKVEIKTEKGLVLMNKSLELKAGLNYFNYDMSFDSTLVKEYASWLNEKKGKEDEEIKPERKDSGKYYLSAGTYTVVITDANGKTDKKEFVISKQKSRQKVRAENEGQHE